MMHLSKVILKTDMKSLKILVKKECIEFLTWIFANWRETEDSGVPEELYDLYLEDKEKQKV